MKVAELIGHLLKLPMNAELLPYWEDHATEFEGFVQNPASCHVINLDTIYLDCGSNSSAIADWDVPSV